MRFQAALEKVVANLKDALADGRITIAEGMEIGNDVMVALQLIMVGIGDDDAAFNELVTDVEALVKKYVVDVDLPINDFVEGWFIDPYTIPMVRPALTWLRQKVKDSTKPQPVTPTTQNPFDTH